jgi:hypothetical protein
MLKRDPLGIGSVTLGGDEPGMASEADWLMRRERAEDKRRPPYVYIASPYTKGDLAANVAHSMAAAHVVLDAGLPVYCPLLTHFLHMQSPRSYEDWMALDLAWLRRCDALIRLPGDSPGADREVEEAKRLGLPVYVVGSNVAHVADAVSRIWPAVTR